MKESYREQLASRSGLEPLRRRLGIGGRLSLYTLDGTTAKRLRLQLRRLKTGNFQYSMITAMADEEAGISELVTAGINRNAGI